MPFTHFRQVEGSIDHLTTGMSLLYPMVKKLNTTTATERKLFEGGSCDGEKGCSGSGNGSGNGNQGKDKEDPNAERAKSVEDSSTQGEKPQDVSGLGKDNGVVDSGRDKGKGKQVLQSSNEDYYYQGEQDDFDAFNIQEEELEKVEELPGVNEYEEEASFDNWKEGELPSDPLFNEEFKSNNRI